MLNCPNLGMPLQNKLVEVKFLLYKSGEKHMSTSNRFVNGLFQFSKTQEEGASEEKFHLDL